MSPLIGFTVLKDKVQSGEKRQTIRRHRKLPVKVGNILYLYWHLRQKDCELLRVEKCVETFTKPWGMLKVSEEIAKRDGFKSSTEMREWFNKTHHLPDDKDLFDVIRW